MQHRLGRSLASAALAIPTVSSLTKAALPCLPAPAAAVSDLVIFPLPAGPYVTAIWSSLLDG